MTKTIIEFQVEAPMLSLVISKEHQKKIPVEKNETEISNRTVDRRCIENVLKTELL